MNKEIIKRAIAEYTQPLYSGLVEYKDKVASKLYDVLPFGELPNGNNAFPYGIASWPVKGIKGFFLNLGGSLRAPIIINHYDKDRPVPSSEGEFINYSRNTDGEVTVRMHLKPDGVLEIHANTKVKIFCDDIELGEDQLEKILNGETFQERFNNHKHIGNMGVETSPPIPDDQSPPSDLSSVVKAKK